jgi:hypothetical protein
LSKTFVDQIPPASGRKYTIVAGTDGTVQINDVTVYEQEGTPWGAEDANQAMQAVDDVAAAQTNITALQNAFTPKSTAGTAPNFTVDDATVTAYESGLRRTIIAHADSGINPTLNFNGKGAKSVFQSTGKAASWKAGQHVVVEYDGTNFFVCSAGGGVEFPSTPSAGDTPIYAKTGYASTISTSYVNAGAGWGFVAQKSGVYRIHYIACGNNNNTGYAQLVINGVAVTNSQISSGSSVSKTMDIALTAGQRLDLQIKAASASWGASTRNFVVSILAAEVQTAINDILTATTT